VEPFLDRNRSGVKVSFFFDSTFHPTFSGRQAGWLPHGIYTHLHSVRSGTWDSALLCIGVAPSRDDGIITLFPGYSGGWKSAVAPTFILHGNCGHYWRSCKWLFEYKL